MKLIRIPFIIAFIVASMALGMAYVSGIRRDAEPTDYLWYDALQELNELGRAKYRQSRRYNDYAHRAELDSLPSQAALFRALSFADNVQCENCRKAIESLGGRFHIPVVATTSLHDIPTHLNLALEEKHSLHDQLTVQCLHRAIGDGNRYIARIITWCDASDIAQIAILRSTLETFTSQREKSIPPYRVCPTCGAISNAELFTDYCPLCMTAVEEFRTFE
ncbi:MAG: hypothetical protein J6Q29_04060 [Alistipes sp.]|nr:hypothetical protein [Alistipes sp.]